MKLRPNKIRLPTFLFSALVLLANGVAAREYPLFQPMSPQNFVFRFGAVSDQSSKGTSTARIRMFEKSSEEKFPFLRLDFDVKARESKSPGFAGVMFKLNEARLTESDVQNAILMRLRLSSPGLPVIMTLKDDRGGESSLELTRFEPKGNSTWKYYEIPFSEFEKVNPAIRPFIDSITLQVNRPGPGSIDVAMIGINAP